VKRKEKGQKKVADTGLGATPFAKDRTKTDGHSSSAGPGQLPLGGLRKERTFKKFRGVVTKKSMKGTATPRTSVNPR